jgi:hypothetical protein
VFAFYCLCRWTAASTFIAWRTQHPNINAYAFAQFFKQQKVSGTVMKYLHEYFGITATPSVLRHYEVAVAEKRMDSDGLIRASMPNDSGDEEWLDTICGYSVDNVNIKRRCQWGKDGELDLLAMTRVRLKSTAETLRLRWVSEGQWGESGKEITDDWFELNATEIELRDRLQEIVVGTVLGSIKSGFHDEDVIVELPDIARSVACAVVADPLGGATGTTGQVIGKDVDYEYSYMGEGKSGLLDDVEAYMIMMLRIAADRGHEQIILHCDEQMFALAKKIKAKDPKKYEKIFVVPGTWHFLYHLEVGATPCCLRSCLAFSAFFPSCQSACLVSFPSRLSACRISLFFACLLSFWSCLPAFFRTCQPACLFAS